MLANERAVRANERADEHIWPSPLPIVLRLKRAMYKRCTRPNKPTGEMLASHYPGVCVLNFTPQLVLCLRLFRSVLFSIWVCSCLRLDLHLSMLVSIQVCACLHLDLYLSVLVSIQVCACFYLGLCLSFFQVCACLSFRSLLVSIQVCACFYLGLCLGTAAFLFSLASIFAMPSRSGVSPSQNNEQ